MKIREIRNSDRAEWLRMLLELYTGSEASDHVESVDAFLDGLECEQHLPAVVFVCECGDGELAGFLELSIRNYAEGCSGATPFVESWFVAQEVRGTGIGRQLMEAAEQWAINSGFDEIASDAELENSLSHRAHAAVGFSEVERSVHFRKSLRADR